MRATTSYHYLWPNRNRSIVSQRYHVPFPSEETTAQTMTFFKFIKQ